MKSFRFFLLVVLFLCPVTLFGQVVVDMEPDGGVYKIPCKVNGAKMKLIFDTGAASVCISQTMAEYLLDNDYLTKDDIVGFGSGVVADGRIVNNIHIIIRDLEIAGIHLANVEAVVTESQIAPLLLGQSAIQKLGKVSIDGNKLIIENADNSFDEARIDALIEKGKRYYKANDYYSTSKILEEVHRVAGLSPAGLYVLIDCYSRCDQDDQVLSLFQEWENDCSENASTMDNDDVYRAVTYAYINKENYQAAISLLNRRISALKKVVNKTRDTKSDEFYASCAAYSLLGTCYSYLNSTDLAIENHKNAVALFHHYIDATIDDVAEGKVHDSMLGMYYYFLALDYPAETTSFKYNICMACKCQYQDAINLLQQADAYYDFMYDFDRAHKRTTKNTKR